MVQFLKRKEVEARTGMSRSMIYALMSEGKFPRPVTLGLNSVAWVEEEIVRWQENRIAERDRRYGIVQGR